MTDVVVIARHELVALQQENKRLREFVDKWGCFNLDDIYKDAERYRWMKAHRAADSAIGIDSWDLFHSYRTTEWDEIIDKAIDAAREQ